MTRSASPRKVGKALPPDPRTINSEGDPFGPRLAEMLREKAATFHDYAASAVMEMAAQFVDAVNEGAVIAMAPSPRKAGARRGK